MNTNEKNAQSLSAGMEDLRNQMATIKKELEENRHLLLLANASILEMQSEIKILKYTSIGRGSTQR
jgi:hypothetical protein